MGLAKQEIEYANAGKGCLGNAKDDEPVFILRAQDRFAPQLVEAWARMVGDAVHNKIDSNSTKEKVRQARALAHQMRAWQELNTCKTPD